MICRMSSIFLFSADFGVVRGRVPSYVLLHVVCETFSEMFEKEGHGEGENSGMRTAGARRTVERTRFCRVASSAPLLPDWCNDVESV